MWIDIGRDFSTGPALLCGIGKEEARSVLRRPCDRLPLVRKGERFLASQDAGGATAVPRREPYDVLICAPVLGIKPVALGAS